jgi:hypothetical protein
MRILGALFLLIGLIVFFMSNWLYGGIMVIMGLLMIMVAANTSPREELERRAIQAGTSKKCPYCAETIKREATVCRFCGRDLPTMKSVAQTLYDSALLADGIITQEEVEDYAAAFEGIGWKEPLGPKTKRALTKLVDPFDPSVEAVICAAYADTRGSHIGPMRVGDHTIDSSHSALIATQKRLLLVNPDHETLHEIPYASIVPVHPPSDASPALANPHKLNTTDGLPVEITVIGDPSTTEDVNLTLAALICRISRVSAE